MPDARRPGEYAAEHAEDVGSFQLDYLNDFVGELDKNEMYFIHCAGGYRSVIMASIL